MSYISDMKTLIRIVEPIYGKDTDGFQTVSEKTVAEIPCRMEVKNATEKWTLRSDLKDATAIMTLVNAFSDPESAEVLIGGAIDIVVGVATGIIDNVAEIVPAALEMAKGIASALINYDWGKVGIEILKAIWNGMWKLGADLRDPVFMEYARVVQEERDRNAKPEPKTQKKHRSGLAYVPYDGYIAELHQGERVLTAYEAQTYSSGNSGSATEVRALRQELAAMREDMRRYGLPVDVRNANQIGKQVGKAVRAS